VENLIPIDYTQKFMQNYKKSDLKFFKENFSNYEKNKTNLNLDPNVPHNYSSAIEILSKSYLYELGYKKAYAYLTTDDHAKKAKYVDINLFFDRRYSTMYPKSNMLGQEPDKDFTKKIKKIGDISFEEVNNESENIKNMYRLPPENITEEWIKENLNTNVEMLRLENCYWLSKDLISKLGRLDKNLKELSLRNLEIENSVVENILRFAKSMEILDISNCNSLTLGICEILKNHAPKLQSLKLFSVLNAIDDKGLESLSHIPELSELDIGLCTEITDNGLINFSKNKIQKMKSLNLTGLINITNTGIKSLLNNNFQSLNNLTISLMPNKNVDSDICSEISKCKKLKNLDLSGCTNITNDAIGNLFSGGLDFLESLNLSGLPINDSTIESCLNSNKSLKILRLSNCKDISNNILDYIINNNNALLLLEINRTKKIDDAKINECVLKRAPNLRIIRASNLHWDPKNNGLKVPLIRKDYVKPQMKGAKAAPKKNDDKNPASQLKKMMEDNKPKRPTDFKI
jgi:hypothetical protein